MFGSLDLMFVVVCCRRRRSDEVGTSKLGGGRCSST